MGIRGLCVCKETFRTGGMIMEKIVDVSRWNGKVDYSALKKSGITGVIIQAGYGMVDSQKDPYFEENYRNAKKAGFKIGAYLYSYAMSTAQAKAEAKVMYGWIKGKTFDLPVYIDMEENSQANLGRDTCTKIAEIFCNNLKSMGYMVGVYANANWFRNYLDYNKLKSKYSIWLAQYSNEKDFDCDIWQYSDSGRIKDNACFFDMNYVYKTPVVNVKLKKNAGLYSYAYSDPVGKTSLPVKSLKKGTTLRWLFDDNYGWSKVRYGNKEYFVVNSRLDKKGLSSYPKEKLKKDTKVYLEKKGKLINAKLLKKNKTVTVLCTIERGKFKGYDYLNVGDKRYYRK